MNDERKDLHPGQTPTGRLDEAAPESHAHQQTDHDQAAAGTARAAGLEPDSSTPGTPDRKATGELDRAVNAPDHDESRSR